MTGHPSIPMTTEIRRSWRTVLTLLTICLTTAGLAFRRDLSAAVSLWVDFPTYNYCFLILPISLYLIWKQREALAEFSPSPSAAGVALSLACLIIWWVANAALVSELRQFALVGLLQGVVWAILGGRIYRCLRFPLLYLFLMVPTGTVLLGPLQFVAARLSTALLRLASIPVFTEGVVVEVPTGLYTVAPGCAGLNFLLAALALSLLYARHTYLRAGKQVACVSAALAIAILANGVRIFGIIWLAEISLHHIDIVSDHLLYGWAFFSLVIVASMVVGNLFADYRTGLGTSSAVAGSQSQHVRPMVSTMAAALAVATLMVAVASHAAITAAPQLADSKVTLDLPDSLGDWRKIPAGDRWTPDFPHADASLRSAYAKNGQQIEVFVAYYWPQREGHKVMSSDNAFVGEADGTVVEDQPAQVVSGRTRLEVSTLHIEAQGRSNLLWFWYWMAGRQAAGSLQAHLFALAGRLAGDNRAAAIAITTDEGMDAASAKAALTAFVADTDGFASVLGSASRTSNPASLASR